MALYGLVRAQTREIIPFVFDTHPLVLGFEVSRDLTSTNKEDRFIVPRYEIRPSLLAQTRFSMCTYDEVTFQH